MITNRHKQIEHPYVITLKATREERMNFYDSLPKHVREFLANAPYSIRVKADVNLDRIQEIMNDYMQKQILITYGPDHPQYVG